MKKLLIIIVLLTGCATVPCPQKDVVAATKEGCMMLIEKGFFDEPGNHMEREEFDKLWRLRRGGI